MLSIYEVATGDRSSYLIKSLNKPQPPHINHHNLHTILREHDHEQSLVLLDENNFVMAHHHNTIYTDHAYTATDLHQACLDISKNLHRTHNIPGQQIYYYVHHIHVNDEPKEHLIGHAGKLSREITCIYVKNNIVPLLEQHRNNIHILPQSLATIHHIQTHLKKKSFSVLQIHNDYLKIITIKNHKYINSRTLDRGKKKLTEMVTESGVGQYFLKNNTGSNPMIEKILQDCFSFYCEMIVNQLNENGLDLIVISDLIKRSMFMDIFQKQYYTNKQGYIVPLHMPKHSDNHLTTSDIIFSLQYMGYLQKHLISVL